VFSVLLVEEAECTDWVDGAQRSRRLGVPARLQIRAPSRGDMTLTWTPAEQAAPVRSAHERTLAPEGVAGRSDELLVCRDDRLFPVDWLRRVAIERVGITPTRSMAVTASP
jgi:hypothetical protein